MSEGDRLLGPPFPHHGIYHLLPHHGQHQCFTYQTCFSHKTRCCTLIEGRTSNLVWILGHCSMRIAQKYHDTWKDTDFVLITITNVEKIVGCRENDPKQWKEKSGHVTSVFLWKRSLKTLGVKTIWTSKKWNASIRFCCTLAHFKL